MPTGRALILLVSTLALPPISLGQQSQLGAGSTNLQSFRGDAGRRLTFVCPPGQASGNVYGTDVYTDDSSVCAAAVHAGAVTPEKGGPVTVVIGGAQQRYTGSSRNGVRSQEFAAWPGSFSFDQKGRPGAIGWHTTAKGAEGYAGSVTVLCPRGGKPQNVWGTGPYTGDSSICSAAVHAGKITLAEGGPVTIRLTEGKEAYQGSTQNGVVTREYGRWDTSFEVLATSKEMAAATVDSSAMPTRARAPAGVATATTRAAPTTQAQSVDTSASAPTATEVGTPAPTQAVAMAAAPAIVSATGFKGVAGPNYSQLSWNSAPGAIGYQLSRYDPTAQQRLILRGPTGDMMLAQTGYTDTAVTPNRTYGYRLRTFFKDQNGAIVSDPDTAQGVSVTPKDPNAPLALPPNFQDSIKLQFTLSPPDPNRPYGHARDTIITLSWEWRTGAAGYRIVANEYTGYGSWLAAVDGRSLALPSSSTGPGSSFVGPYASTQLRWDRPLHPGAYPFLFCVFAVSPVDPATGKRVESRPGRLKLSNMSSPRDPGQTWQVEQIPGYPVGFDKCPDAPEKF